MKKYFFFFSLVFIFSILFPFPTQAIDQRCWKKSDCVAQRSKTYTLMDQKPEDGFVHNAETIQACGANTTVDGKTQELGFCLPVGTTETKISFGGTKKFSDIADFIRYMYRYGIMVAGVISVIMIIIAGFQWTISGGNPSNIQAAQKRIQGAIIGLTLALLSYSILNFVNPNLVNFRLPQIWLINTLNLSPAFCDSDELKDTKLALLSESTSKNLPLSSTEVDKRFKMATFTIPPSEAKCGNSYFLEGAGGLSCAGVSCGFSTGQVCDLSISECRPGVIAGVISNSNPVDEHGGAVGTIFGSWVWDSGVIANHKGWIIDGFAKEAIQLVRICNSDLNESSYNNMANTNENGMKYDDLKKTQNYLIPVSSNSPDNLIAEATSNCSDNGGLKGFMLEVGMHEITKVGGMTEVHFLGRSRKNSRAVDLGDSDSIGDVLGSPGINELLITPDDLRKGIILNIDVADVYNNENDADSAQHYSQKFFVSTP